MPNKYNCGQVLPSSCVPFTGKDLTILVEPNELSCDANLDEVIEKLDQAIKKLMDSNDFTELEPVEDCFEFNPATVTAKELHALEIEKLCIHEGQIAALQQQLNDLNIGNEIITINLPTCLQPDAAPCAVGTNEYQLISLLMLFANKLCDLEQQISDL